jgi:tetratricopeptide (TPR) repeat protein
LEIGEDEEAMRFYKETLRVERHALGPDHHDVVLTLQHMGQVHQQRGELDQALGYFSEALAIERKKNGDDHMSVAKVLNLIGNIHLQRAETSEMMKCYVESSRIYKKHGHPQETLVIAGYNFYALSKNHPECASNA